METPYPWWLPEALSYADGKRFLIATPPTNDGDEYLTDPFTVEDVASTHLEWNDYDENDPWSEGEYVAVLRLRDGRWASVSAWHDSTGWDCRSGLDAYISDSLDSLLRWGLTDTDRRRVGVELDVKVTVPALDLSADEWRIRALAAEAMVEDCEDERNRMVARAHAAEAERDLLAGIIAKLKVAWDTERWPNFTPAEADAVRRIIGEGER